MIKKTIALTLCTSVFMAPGAMGEACFDVENVVVNSDSHEEAVERLARLKGGLAKYFSIMGEEQIPEDISWDEAEDLVRFLRHEGVEVGLNPYDGEDSPWFRIPLGVGAGGATAFSGAMFLATAVRVASQAGGAWGGAVMGLIGAGLVGGAHFLGEYLATDDCDLALISTRVVPLVSVGTGDFERGGSGPARD